MKEVASAKKKHPSWPVHIVAQAGIVSEEAGELIRAALNWKYERKEGDDEKDQLREIRKEAIHVAAVAIRFLTELDKTK